MSESTQQIQSAIESQVELAQTFLTKYTADGKTSFATSSFQSHSIPMLHVISQFAAEIPIYFLNTGFHFPETLLFKEQVANELNLNVIDLRSPISKINQRDKQQQFFFMSDPDHCCYLNKVLPMEPIIAQHDVWISGVRKDQNTNRSNFSMEQKGVRGSSRFHPMLNWTNRMIWHYIEIHALPQHPLGHLGHASIGCAPCTVKAVSLNEDERDGRWAGLKKTECGLHIDLAGSE